MSELSQSQFLQALGWATLNSFWQMALLWCVFVGANHLFNLTASRKYLLSVSAILIGFFWFLITFAVYFQKGSIQVTALIHLIKSSDKILPICLVAASVTYLALLMIPAYRLILNWRYVQILRTTGLQKVDIHYKLFVKKVAGHLGIKKNVGVYISELVKSPVTIGYLKPIILLPVASINQLTVPQAEAVLLHELSHIRRYDYLLNLLISIAHTFLYFNPFVRLFIKTAEEERENCCDQVVLQFGYDKISYASALLSLEKSAHQNHLFAIGATGKQNLLTRIEKIVGMEKKPVFRFTHFASIIAALLCIFAINSIVIGIKETDNADVSFDQLANPFYFLNNGEEFNSSEDSSKNNATVYEKSEVPAPPAVLPSVEEIYPPLAVEEPPIPSEYLPVSLDETEVRLTNLEKEQVKTTVENTKKVLGSVQWKEVEKVIGDAMNEEEKSLARRDYLREIENIDWENLEKNLKADYEKIDWAKIDTDLKKALATVQLDSIQASYEQMLIQIERSVAKDKLPAVDSMPFPDESLKEIQHRQKQIQNYLQEIKALKENKVIKL